MKTEGTDMRKIEIDGVVRRFADDYKSKVILQLPDVTVKLQELAKFVADNNPWTDKNAITDYIGQMIADYSDLLTLEPKNWQTYIYKYNKVLVREPNMLTMEMNYRQKAKGGFYKGKLYERILACLGYEDARLILGPIHQTMGLKTCVYCNVNPTIAVEGDVMYQMDHFMPQSKYPFLGTCFYNLQPSCGICNGHKGKKSCDFGLYVNVEQRKELNPFRFVSIISQVPMKENGECMDIQLRSKNKTVTEECKKHDKMFHIHTMYSAYKSKVSELYDRCYQLNESAVSAMAAAFRIPPTKECVLSFISGNFSSDETKIHQEPFTKLKQDTILQMKEGGLLPK